MTTEQVTMAAEVGQKTVLRWMRVGLLPAYPRGARARDARWPVHAPEQAQRIRARIEEGLTFPDIFAALERGEFKPSTT